MRGDEDEIFFAKRIGERDQIIKLFLNDAVQDRIMITPIFTLSSSYLLAFEQDYEYRYDDETKDKEILK